MPTYSFHYPSRPESEERMLDDLEEVLTDSGVPLGSCRGFLLAVSEAFNNAMIHGNGSDPAKQVILGLEVNENAIVADIVDEGHDGLSRLRSRKPRGLMAEGGRGIDLIGHFADSVDFSQIHSGGLKVSIRIERNKTQKTI